MRVTLQTAEVGATVVHAGTAWKVIALDRHSQTLDLEDLASLRQVLGVPWDECDVVFRVRIEA